MNIIPLLSGRWKKQDEENVKKHDERYRKPEPNVLPQIPKISGSQDYHRSTYGRHQRFSIVGKIGNKEIYREHNRD